MPKRAHTLDWACAVGGGGAGARGTRRLLSPTPQVALACCACGQKRALVLVGWLVGFCVGVGFGLVWFPLVRFRLAGRVSIAIEARNLLASFDS